MNRRENSNVFKKLDPKKWEQVSKKFNNKTEFSKSLGHAPGFYQNVLTSGVISVTDILLVKALYNIDVELKEPKMANFESTQLPLEELETLSRKISANNVVLKNHSEEISGMKEQLKDIVVSLRTIGNLLTQINEKIYKENKE